jgi:hypothetical protein
MGGERMLNVETLMSHAANGMSIRFPMAINAGFTAIHKGTSNQAKMDLNASAILSSALKTGLLTTMTACLTTSRPTPMPIEV